MHQVEWALAYQGMAILERYRRAANSVVTAGAYLGQESFFYAFWFKQVHMFEPIKELNAFIRQTFETNSNDPAFNRNRCEWHLHEKALGSKFEQRIMNQVYHKDFSIVAAPYSAIDENRSRFEGDTLRLQTVDVIPLDSLDLSPDLLQLDVEGFEYEALLGATNTIKRCRPVIQIETLTESIQRFLHDHGYTEVRPWVNNLVDTEFAVDRYYIHVSET